MQKEMNMTMYSEEEGKMQINDHEKALGKAVLEFVMNGGGGNKLDLCYYMLNDTDGRYFQVDFLVWRFMSVLPSAYEEKKEVFEELIQFAEWAIECRVDAMDRHFTDSIRELLKIPQLSEYHYDILTVWNNYAELAMLLGLTIGEFGVLNKIDQALEYSDNNYYYTHPNIYCHTKYYNDKVMKVFALEAGGLLINEKVEEFLRKNTSYPYDLYDN